VRNKGASCITPRGLGANSTQELLLRSYRMQGESEGMDSAITYSHTAEAIRSSVAGFSAGSEGNPSSIEMHNPQLKAYRLSFAFSVSKAIPVTGLGGLQGCEMLKIPHCLDNRLTDGGKFVSLTHPQHSVSSTRRRRQNPF
jgi:hypothetical protein